MSKKIAVLITDDFEDSEFTSPAEAFKLAGHQVITIEKQAGKTVKSLAFLAWLACASRRLLFNRQLFPSLLHDYACATTRGIIRYRHSHHV